MIIVFYQFHDRCQDFAFAYSTASWIPVPLNVADKLISDVLDLVQVKGG